MHIDNLTREALAPYLPIPHGGRRVLVNIFIAIATIGMISFGWTLLSTHQFGILVPMVGMLLLTWQIVASFRGGEFDNSPTRWFAAFLDRNLGGYQLWCVRNLYGDATVTYWIRHHGDFMRIAENRMAIIVPLRMGARCEVRVPDYSGYWSLRTAGIALDFHAGMIVVRMQDVNGDQITVDVESALRVLLNDRMTMQNDKLTNNIGSAGLLVEGLMMRLDNTRSDLATERKNRDEAVRDIGAAIERINGTKRFIQSKEAAGIRDWLRHRLAAHEAVRSVVLPGQIDT